MRLASTRSSSPTTFHRPLLLLTVLAAVAPADGQERSDRPYRELEGTALEFKYHHEWCSYYWREDFTFLLRDDAGKVHRIISREPTPWTTYRLGTTYPGLKVDWARQPRVRVVGVGGVDRLPQEFYGLKLDPEKTVTAFLVRVDVSGKAAGKPVWKDYFVNNWFHHWGKDADRKVLAHYANDDPNYTVYGFLGDIAAPFDAAGKKLLERYQPDYGGIIYHGRVVKADNDVGYAIHLIHLMGRHKKTQNYDVFYGDARTLVPLDSRPPAKGGVLK